MRARAAKAVQAFSTGRAAEIIGVAHRTVDQWARIGLVAPSVADTVGSGKSRLYNFSDLIALRVARELRSAGISTRALRSIIERLRKEGQGGTLTNARLVSFGSDVALVRNCRELESVLQRPGQGVFAFILDLQKTEEDVKIEAAKQPPARMQPGASKSARGHTRKLPAA
jgi:DNA-binding transcriptional MerR regulator